MVSRTEQASAEMADRRGYTTGESRYPFMVGAMGSFAEDLERVLETIAKPSTRASEARLLAANALAALSYRSPQ